MTTKQPWALVTGASAGIGAEFCRQLAARGYAIVLVARREERLLAMSDAIQEQYGVPCRALTMDLAAPHAARDISDWLAETEIEVEFLVNNAGYGVVGAYNEVPWEQHDRFLKVMLNAVCELTWQLLPGMQRRARGYVVNVSSLAGLVPGAARNTLYGATKAFLVAFSESLGMENESTGVHVTALCPGFTYSEFHDVMDIREQVNRLPSWMWMESPEVVRCGIEAVLSDKPRFVVVPGRVNRFIAMVVRKLPLRSAQAFTQKQSLKFRKQ